MVMKDDDIIKNVLEYRIKIETKIINTKADALIIPFICLDVSASPLIFSLYFNVAKVK